MAKKTAKKADALAAVPALWPPTKFPYRAWRLELDAHTPYKYNVKEVVVLKHDDSHAICSNGRRVYFTELYLTEHDATRCKDLIDRVNERDERIRADDKKRYQMAEDVKRLQVEVKGLSTAKQRFLRAAVPIVSRFWEAVDHVLHGGSSSRSCNMGVSWRGLYGGDR